MVFALEKLQVLAQNFQKKSRVNFSDRQKRSIGMRIAAPGLAMIGWLWVSTAPTMAVTATYNNDYRVCAGRLLSLGVSPGAASQSCGSVLNPREFSRCVYNIEKQTELPATEVLNACRQSRRPEDISACIVGISKNLKEPANPEIINYCGRSLLPLRFAQCVVGLRAEIDFGAIQAMNTCIDASERIGNLSPTFIPASSRSIEFQPTTPVVPRR